MTEESIGRWYTTKSYSTNKISEKHSSTYNRNACVTHTVEISKKQKKVDQSLDEYVSHKRQSSPDKGNIDGNSQSFINVGDISSEDHVNEREYADDHGRDIPSHDKNVPEDVNLKIYSDKKSQFHSGIGTESETDLVKVPVIIITPATHVDLQKYTGNEIECDLAQSSVAQDMNMNDAPSKFHQNGGFASLHSSMGQMNHDKDSDVYKSSNHRIDRDSYEDKRDNNHELKSRCLKTGSYNSTNAHEPFSRLSSRELVNALEKESPTEDVDILTEEKELVDVVCSVEEQPCTPFPSRVSEYNYQDEIPSVLSTSELYAALQQEIESEHKFTSTVTNSSEEKLESETGKIGMIEKAEDKSGNGLMSSKNGFLEAKHITLAYHEKESVHPGDDLSLPVNDLHCNDSSTSQLHRLDEIFHNTKDVDQLFRHALNGDKYFGYQPCNTTDRGVFEDEVMNIERRNDNIYSELDSPKSSKYTFVTDSTSKQNEKFKAREEFFKELSEGSTPPDLNDIHGFGSDSRTYQISETNSRKKHPIDIHEIHNAKTGKIRTSGISSIHEQNNPAEYFHFVKSLMISCTSEVEDDQPNDRDSGNNDSSMTKSLAATNINELGYPDNEKPRTIRRHGGFLRRNISTIDIKDTSRMDNHKEMLLKRLQDTLDFIRHTLRREDKGGENQLKVCRRTRTGNTRILVQEKSSGSETAPTSSDEANHDIGHEFLRIFKSSDSISRVKDTVHDSESSTLKRVIRSTVDSFTNCQGLSETTEMEGSSSSSLIFDICLLILAFLTFHILINYELGI